MFLLRICCWWISFCPKIMNAVPADHYSMLFGAKYMWTSHWQSYCIIMLLNDAWGYRGFVEKGLINWACIPTSSVAGMLASWGHGSKQKEKVSCVHPSVNHLYHESKLNSLSVSLPNLGCTWFSSIISMFPTTHAWLHSPFLKVLWQRCKGHNILLCEGGRQDNLKRAEGILDWVYSASRFGVDWQPAWGHAHILGFPLPWVAVSSGRECTVWAAVNLQWTLGLG